MGGAGVAEDGLEEAVEDVMAAGGVDVEGSAHAVASGVGDSEVAGAVDVVTVAVVGGEEDAEEAVAA